MLHFHNYENMKILVLIIFHANVDTNVNILKSNIYICRDHILFGADSVALNVPFFKWKLKAPCCMIENSPSKDGHIP